MPDSPAVARGPSPTLSLSSRYRTVRARTTGLAEPLSPEDCALQSMPDASPVKWHLGHTSWFFETFVLADALPDHRPFRDAFRVLFNSYYVAVGPRHPRPERGLLSRPALDEVLAYRRHVDAAMATLFEHHPDRAAAAGALIELGLNHEEQHQELILTDLKHLLSRNPLAPVYRADAATPSNGAAPPPAGWRRLPEGVRRIGYAGPDFCFDNEQPAHRAFVGAVDIADRAVTCGEYLAFIRDGGYDRSDLWLSEGWDTVRRDGWRAPQYWHCDGNPAEADGWQSFTLGGLRPVDPAEPVTHVSYYEADAFARWAGARLPTEAEWEAATDGIPVAGNFLDSGRRHPAPLDAAGAPGGQLFGDVWEWTSSSYAPYPGFRAAPGAVGEYNGKFMVNQYVLRGGSCATSPGHVRATYRNFFPAHARWQFSGIRLARDPG